MGGLLFVPQHDKTNKMTCAPSEGSDQIKSLRCQHKETLDPWLPIPHTAKTDQTVRMDAQAYQSLRWAHKPFCWFCHAPAHLLPIGFLFMH